MPKVGLANQTDLKVWTMYSWLVKFYRDRYASRKNSLCWNFIGYRAISMFCASFYWPTIGNFEDFLTSET
jgi:hypothetical protein